MSLSGAQVTRLWPYGGPGGQYGAFSGKSAGATKSYTATFTQHVPYGGIGVPYGSFAGKVAGTPFVLDAVTIALSGTLAVTANDFDVDVNWDFEPPLELALNGVIGITANLEWNPVGTLARTNANDTLAATGTTTVVGTLARTNANDTIAASGAVGTSGPVGTLAVTTQNDTSAISGTPEIVGTLAATNQNDTLSAFGGSTSVGTLAVTNQNDTSTATGMVGDPPVGAATRLPLTNAGST